MRDVGLINSRSHVPREVAPLTVLPRFGSTADASVCQGLPLSFSESFDKADGAGWDVDATWGPLPVFGSFDFAHVATLDGCATVDHPAACSGNGLFLRAANAMVPADDAQLLTPDQVVQATFVGFTPTWGGSGSGYENNFNLYARLCDSPPGQSAGQACYGISFGSIGSEALGGPFHPTATIFKEGGSIGETLASRHDSGSELSPGDVITFECIGNSLALQVNGSTILSCSGDSLGSPYTGPPLNPVCSSAGMNMSISCVDVTAPGQGPFTGAGGWNTIKFDDWSVVASV